MTYSTKNNRAIASADHEWFYDTKITESLTSSIDIKFNDYINIKKGDKLFFEYTHHEEDRLTWSSEWVLYINNIAQHCMSGLMLNADFIKYDPDTSFEDDFVSFKNKLNQLSYRVLIEYLIKLMSL